MSTRGHHQLLLQVGGAPPVVGHLYWRVRCDRNAVTSTGALAVTSVNEIEMRATPGGADLCTGGTAIALNVNATTPASRAFDNDNSDYINSSTVSLDDGQPWWIGYQFATAVDVQEVAIWKQQYSSGDIRAMGSVYIEWSDDNATWTTASSYLAANDWPATGAGAKVFAVPYLHAGDDPAFPWVSTLIDASGADESTTITDYVPGVTWTVVGGTKVDDAVLLDGNPTLLFNASGDYAYCSGASLGFGVWDFDVEGSVYSFALTGANRCILDFRHGAVSNVALYSDSGTGGAGKLALFSNGGLMMTHQTPMTANTWHRFRIMRRGGHFALWLDGVRSTATYTGTAGSAYSSSAGRLYIGDNYIAPSQPVNGRLGPLRVTRYARKALAGDYTPATGFFPNN